MEVKIINVFQLPDYIRNSIMYNIIAVLTKVYFCTVNLSFRLVRKTMPAQQVFPEQVRVMRIINRE